MKKRLASALVVFLGVILTLVNSNMVVKAAEITPYWTNVATISNTLSISNGTASMRVNVRSYNNIKRVEVTARLQRYSGGWSTIGTYFPVNNNYYLIWEGSQAVSRGYNYRLYSTVKVFELSGGTYILKETIDRTHDFYY